MIRSGQDTDEFSSTLQQRTHVYGMSLADEHIRKLQDYYELLMAWNARLHLVSPCTPAEFATRHVLESLFALSYIRQDSHVVDVGSGAGLPGIPCAIVRPDIRVTLIESSQKKAIFLHEAIKKVNRVDRASVLNARFETTPPPQSGVMMCRALERFSEMLETLLDWAQEAEVILLFGGRKLGEQIGRLNVKSRSIQLPESDQRFLFVVDR